MLTEQKNNENAYFTPEQRDELNKMHLLLKDSVEIALKSSESTNNVPNLELIKGIEHKLNESRDNINKELFSEKLKKSNIKSAFYFNKFTESYEKIGDFLYIINKSLIELNS